MGDKVTGKKNIGPKVIDFPKIKLEVNDELVEVLKELLEEAKQGKITSAGVVAITPSQDVFSCYSVLGNAMFHLMAGITLLLRRTQEELPTFNKT